MILDNDVINDQNTAVIDEIYGGAVEVRRFVKEADRNDFIEDDRFASSTGIPYTPKSRKKRSSSSENIVELMVVADKKMADYHGDELHNYILTLMSIVRVFLKSSGSRAETNGIRGRLVGRLVPDRFEKP